MQTVAVLFRALTYATAFIGFFLVFVPSRLLGRVGPEAPAELGAAGAAGAAVTVAGALLAVSCVVTFAVVGRGTPAPFDPPRRLVVRGPYSFVRNPMYLGAGLALAGAALVYRSLALAAYAGLFAGAVHLFVRLYEEPALARAFPAGYEDYRRRVPRWVPRFPRRAG